MSTLNQAVHLNMFQSIDEFITTNAQVLIEIPGFKELTEMFNVNLAQIYILNKNQSGYNTGEAQILQLLKEKLIDTSFSVATKVKAFAIYTNNQKLRREVGYTKLDFVKKSYQNLILVCDFVYKRAAENIDKLRDYSVTPQSLAEFKKLLENCRSTIPKLRVNINSRKDSTMQINISYKKNFDLLVKMDAMIEVIRDSHPDILSDYKNARKIIDVSSRKLKIFGKIIDKGTRVPIRKAVISFFSREEMNGNAIRELTDKQLNNLGEPIITKATAVMGGFRIDSLLDGPYHVMINRHDYQTKILSVFIQGGEPTKLVVELEKV